MNVSFFAKEYVPEGSVHWSELQIFHEHYHSARSAYVKTRAEADVNKWEKETHFRYVHENKKICKIEIFILK